MSPFSFGSKNKATPVPLSKSSGYDDYGHDGKPEMIEGWVEKKGGGRVKMGEGWQKRYLRIDEKNACLSYFKSSR